MALELLFGIDTAKIGSIELDASVTEEHSADSEVTDHPIEEGADVSDNIRTKPKQIRITGVISNTPLFFLNFNSGDRAVSEWTHLNDLKDNAILITVITTLQTYENMAITSLTTTRDAKRGNVLEFTANLREIITAKSQTVKTTSPAASASALGKRPTPPAPPPVQASILAKGFL